MNVESITHNGRACVNNYFDNYRIGCSGERDACPSGGYGSGKATCTGGCRPFRAARAGYCSGFATCTGYGSGFATCTGYGSVFATCTGDEGARGAAWPGTAP